MSACGAFHGALAAETSYQFEIALRWNTDLFSILLYANLNSYGDGNEIEIRFSAFKHFRFEYFILRLFIEHSVDFHRKEEGEVLFYISVDKNFNFSFPKINNFTRYRTSLENSFQVCKVKNFNDGYRIKVKNDLAQKTWLDERIYHFVRCKTV